MKSQRSEQSRIEVQRGSYESGSLDAALQDIDRFGVRGQ